MSLFRSREEPESNELIDGLARQVAESAMPPKIKEVAQRELGLLSNLSTTSAEYSISLTYINYLTSISWGRLIEENLDIHHARRILDERHFGLDEVKQRVLEHLAVLIRKRTEGIRVLVVDDDETARKNLLHILEKEGYQTCEASDGTEALKRLDEEHYDLMIADLRMSRLGGLELLEESKARYPNIKVIIITGYGSVDSAVQSMRKGAFHFITKPYKLDEVRNIVRSAAEQSSRTLSSRGPVLCFSGPPGTGKTSIGRSIADALGRPLVRISLGGLRDESEIRGHRRTYAGAMPGRIVEEIRRAECMNPLIMLDEMDKMGSDAKGDPGGALLEALDPEQNHAFMDHYLDVPFDLSRVMFVVTANVVDLIPGALRDRLEVVGFSGYSADEKKHIAINHLLPRQIRQQALSTAPPVFDDAAVEKLIDGYTREAGIRELERCIASVCRKILLQTLDNPDIKTPVTVTPEYVEQLMGPPKYYEDETASGERPGIARGLVWTEAGGRTIFVEAARMPGEGELILTGSLGSVMRESARIALSYIRSDAGALGIAEELFQGKDFHIHVPAGAIQKDGPSAGATIAAALISLLKGTPARGDTAITGELTLSGRLLPVGGVKEKVLAARRAGLARIIMPLANRRDVESLPPSVSSGLDIHYINHMYEAVGAVIGPSDAQVNPLN